MKLKDKIDTNQVKAYFFSNWIPRPHEDVRLMKTMNSVNIYAKPLNGILGYPGTHRKEFICNKDKYIAVTPISPVLMKLIYWTEKLNLNFITKSLPWLLSYYRKIKSVFGKQLKNKENKKSHTH